MFMKMRRRSNIIPRTTSDLVATSFLAIMIPIIYYFELWVVLPSVHNPGTLMHGIHFALGSFLLYNVTSNFLAVILCDTSLKGVILSPDDSKSRRFCASCECFAPPRSWHCNICKTCILKRDHHCVFTGCCIGHRNHRFFFYLVLYMFIATSYATYYNTFFVLERVSFRSWWDISKIIFPFAMLAVYPSAEQIYLALFQLTIIGLALTAILFAYHFNLLKNGTVVYERKSRLYDFGFKQNLHTVFGERWYLTWISPTIESYLPHDGIHWDVKSTNKGK
ncbi:probable palmitoyltransferase ZDHHC24 [Ctenocephalides felis]|uniref:probable palmitoyltransferase ZDHHC24 n=1 Tax=Ctenocephalides felis TaxID=7515 RepID=UPI000E6E122F|nr:probable palmitoyltransferase ZDHHC24 [Ctenocephalides felis]